MSLNKKSIFTIVALLVITGAIHQEFFSEDTKAFGQYYDIAQIMADKFTFEIGDGTYDVYYGYKGSLDSMGSEFIEPVVSSMNINEERKSIEITMESVPEKTDFWVRIPQEMLYAENENYVVLVNNAETSYDLIKHPDDYAIGFVISETAENIEIIGTKIVPEFGVYSVMVLVISILVLVFIMQKTSLGSLVKNRY